MRVLAKPEPAMAANGWSFTLPPATVTEVSSLRVAAWLDDAYCKVDSECVALLTRAAEQLAAAGATVDLTARPDVDFETQDRAYQRVLSASMNPGALPLSYTQYQGASARRQMHKEKVWAPCVHS
jgi:amidase